MLPFVCIHALQGAHAAAAARGCWSLGRNVPPEEYLELWSWKEFNLLACREQHCEHGVALAASARCIPSVQGGDVMQFALCSRKANQGQACQRRPLWCGFQFTLATESAGSAFSLEPILWTLSHRNKTQTIGFADLRYRDAPVLKRVETSILKARCPLLPTGYNSIRCIIDLPLT